MEAYYDHVLPALAAGKCVLMDRWVASFYAYQVSGREDMYSKEIYDTLFDDNRTPLIRQPDIYFMGDVKPEVAYERLHVRDGESNYLDKESPEFKQRVADGFKHYTKHHQNVVTLNCNTTPALIKSRAQAYIEVMLLNKRSDALIEKRNKAQKLAQEAQAQ